MNKQTRNLVILVVLLVAGGGLGVYRLTSSDTPAPPPPVDPAAQQAPAPAPPGGTGPAAAQPQPAPGAQPNAQAANQPLPMPAPIEGFTDSGFSWQVTAKTPGVYDPMFVQDLEVVEPGRRKYIEEFRATWQIAGISETHQMVKELDKDGNPVKDPATGKDIESKKPVKEVWFHGKRRPYRENDRLTLTRFIIKKIIQTRDVTAVELEGDNGEKLTLPLVKPDRYGDVK